ncbi:7-carboxy-7-deazaguanine synthase QueE [Chloroflexota bacterium]
MLKASRQPDGSPEIFYSVQGEGLNLGKPAIFLRLALCNLACTWCDTRYTWDWQQYDHEEQVLEISKEYIQRQILGYNCQYLVITGGEPMLQQKQILPLLDCLKDKSFYIEIETNGTVIPDPDLASFVDHWSVAPKLQNSGNPLPLREIPQVYRYFTGLATSHFKYTINDEDDFEEVRGIMQKYGIMPERTYLMPQATDRDSLLERSGWLVELCKRHGCLFSTRLQVLLWGDRRGV